MLAKWQHWCELLSGGVCSETRLRQERQLLLPQVAARLHQVRPVRRPLREGDERKDRGRRLHLRRREPHRAGVGVEASRDREVHNILWLRGISPVKAHYQRHLSLLQYSSELICWQPPHEACGT